MPASNKITTDLTPVPSRQNPSTFSADMDALLSKLPTWATQANALADEADANVDLAAAQVALAAEQADLATTNGAAQVALAAEQADLATTNGAAQVALAAEQADLATTNGAAQVALAADQVALAADQVALATTQANKAEAKANIAEIAANAAESVANVSKWVSGTTYTAGTVVWSPINYQSYRRKTDGAGTTDPSSDTTNWQKIIDTTQITISGNFSLYVTQQTTMTITNYDSATTYTVSAELGTASIAGDAITYTAGDTVGTDTLTITAGSSTRTINITISAYNFYIPTPSATPAIGAAFEGGFYTGMIWNELVESSTSMTIGTGSKSFTVPNMTDNAIVYAGQSLEVRSRANPANKMVGTVTGALGTTLTIDVSSVGGSGTFADWSIMARYRVIVAPKSSGESTGKTYKVDNTAAPTACQTLSEGYRATMAMVAAGDATTYPAAWFCKNLNIGSKSDWYLPARDELELCWRNLKPTADANYTSARPDSAIDYKNLGAYDDADTGMGRNLNSSPQGAAYTTSVPAQTSVTAFQTGGAEAFAYGSYYYWSSSEYAAAYSWSQYWRSSLPGGQASGDKYSSYYVRAVRRSII